MLSDVLHVLETFSNRTLVPHPPDVPLTPSEHSVDAVQGNKPFHLMVNSRGTKQTAACLCDRCHFGEK